jgi:hypothetical protein
VLEGAVGLKGCKIFMSACVHRGSDAGGIRLARLMREPGVLYQSNPATSPVDHDTSRGRRSEEMARRAIEKGYIDAVQYVQRAQSFKSSSLRATSLGADPGILKDCNNIVQTCHLLGDRSSLKKIQIIENPIKLYLTGCHPSGFRVRFLRVFCSPRSHLSQTEIVVKPICIRRVLLDPGESGRFSSLEL